MFNARVINTIMQKLTTDEFIIRSIKKHGDYYDYSKSVYIGSKKPIIIRCPKHGDFRQLAANHMQKSGCSFCAEEQKVTTVEHFINVSSKIHDNKYGYDGVVIFNLHTDVKINCPEHGKFLQRPVHHMAGHGCKKCAGMQRSTTEEFINKSNDKHNYRYSYDNVEYINNKTKVKITCSDHGDFEQTPNDHLHGYGCIVCAGTKKITTEEFINRATLIHEKLYDYSNVQIDNMNKKITIACPIHGNFNQRAADHITGCGCPECANGHRGKYSIEYFNNYPDQRVVNGIVYLINIENQWCKIGITKKESTDKRFNSLKKIQVIQEYFTTLKNAYDIEQEILRKYAMFRYKVPELRALNFRGWTECFPIILLPKLIQEFNDKGLTNVK